MTYPLPQTPGKSDSRRQFLKTLAICGAGAAISARPLLGQQSDYKLAVRGGAIDVHHHFSPPGLAGGRGGAAAAGARGAAPAPRGGAGGTRGGGPGPWTVSRSLEQMDRFGIATALMSMTQQGNILYDGTENGRTAVRTCNEFGARLMHDYPRRFGLFASIPFPDVEGSLKEIEYAYDTLKCDGIGIYTNDNQGRWAGDPHLDPIWQELNRRKAVVYMHPWVPACCNQLNYGASPLMAEVEFDTTRAVTSLLVNGVMFRYPSVTLITVHAGGTLPVLTGRMQNRWPADAAKYVPNGLAAELKKLYYDVAHATFQMPMAALLKLVPPTQLLFGTDYFPEGVSTTVNEIPSLQLSRDVLDMIERRNAERLFPRFRAEAG
jgi:predicted TIM-barrel fold metal-dependent hydrolase